VSGRRLAGADAGALPDLVISLHGRTNGGCICNNRS
jgi:hypothetical protein